jgi:hypothetical protein
MMNTQRNINQ